MGHLAFRSKQLSLEPGNNAVLQKCSGSNYLMWSRAARLFLEGKRMWSYVDGSISCPTDVERDFATKYFEWNASNKAIMTWRLGAMNPIIASSHMFLSTAKVVYDQLKNLPSRKSKG